MLKYLNMYKNKYRDQLNKKLMKKEADEPLVEYIKDAWKSLEIAPAIKIVDFKYSEIENDININKYIFKREKNKKKKEKFDVKFINDSRCGSLRTTIEITLPVKDPVSGEITIHKKTLSKDILIPIQDDRGYYTIKGKKYYMIYQLVEKSTYTGKQTITLKSLMPIAIQRNSTMVKGLSFKHEMLTEELEKDSGVMTKNSTIAETVNGDVYKLPVYYIYMFKKETPILPFFLARGVEYALDFLQLNRIISFEDGESFLNSEKSDNELWFVISNNKCYLKVKDKEIFEKYQYLQAMVGSLLDIMSNRLTKEQIYDTTLWVKKLGGGSQSNSYNKGLDMLTFFSRLLDETTKKILRIDDIHKKDIYSLIRWMMMNFNEIRLKDNMNLYNKRIRCNEYISSLLTIEFSRRLNRIISMGNKATMDNYKEIFKFPGEILLQKLHVSGVLRFDDCINDMNFFSKFKVTFKGPHSQGNSNTKKINTKSRGLHPSYLTNFDILVCGTSDPGTSALLSPWCNIKDFYFDSKPEYDNFMYEFKSDIENSSNTESIINIGSDSKERYFEVLNKMADLLSSSKAYGHSNDVSYHIEEGIEDVDSKTLIDKEE